VKYQWPDAARVKLDISPETHASGKLRSNIRATAWFNADTVSTGGAISAFPGLSLGFMRSFIGNLSTGRINLSYLSHKESEILSLSFKYLILKRN
jgi:hypothetical protein